MVTRVALITAAATSRGSRSRPGVGADPPGDPFREALLDHHDGLELFGGQGGRGRDPPRLAQVLCLGGEPWTTASITAGHSGSPAGRAASAACIRAPRP